MIFRFLKNQKILVIMINFLEKFLENDMIITNGRSSLDYSLFTIPGSALH